MDSSEPAYLIEQLLGNATVFVSAVTGLLEHRLLQETAGKQLTLSQLRILQLLDLAGDQNIGDVAAFHGVSNAAASKAVDRLVRRNYVRRKEAAADRRSTELSLAAAGRKLLRKYQDGKSRQLTSLFGHLKPSDLLEISQFLESLTKRIVNGMANPEEICLQCGIHLQQRCLMRESTRAECSYQLRKKKGRGNPRATDIEVPTRGGTGMGPPG